MNNETRKEATVVGKEERNRKTLRIAGIIVAIVVIAALVGNSKWKRASDTAVNDVPADCKPGDVFSKETGKPCPSAIETADTEVRTATSNGPGGYEEAIRMYAGKVIIFDAACKSLPVTPMFTVGTRILVANNSSVALTLALSDKSEKLDPYHYYTYALKTAGDMVVTCNGAAAATISVK